MPLDRNRIKTICFDVDGTLRDTDDQWVLQFARILRIAAFLFPKRNPRSIARRIVMALEDPGNYLLGLADRMGLDDRLARIGRMGSRLSPFGNNRPFPVVEGVPEMLRILQPFFPMAIVSTRSEPATREFLEQNKLAPYFEFVATGQTCPHTKPFPDQIFWVAEKMKVSPHVCLMVGDTKMDVMAGKAAGAQTVGVLCGFGEEDELTRAGADLILPATPDLVRGILPDQFS